MKNKTLVPKKCSKCESIVPKVDVQAASVLCWECTIKLVSKQN